MTTRKRVLSIRLSDAEYQTIKAEAEKAGTSVPLHARRLALDSIEIGPRLDQIERRLRSVPDGAAVLESFGKLSTRIVALQRLAEKIDLATAKGVQP